MSKNYRSTFVFSEINQAVNFYRFRNPARAKYINLLERDNRGNSYAQEFSGAHPNDIWAAVTHAIKKAMCDYPIDWQKAFSMCDLAMVRVHPLEAASELGYTEKMINQFRRRIKEDLGDELRRRELLRYED